MSLIHSPRIVTDGLKLVLDAGVPTSWNVGISTNWTDKVGGNNGTLTNGASHNDGPFVGAGYVDLNSSGDYLSIADSADLELDTNTTIELFIKFNTIPTVATYIFGKINGYWLAYDSTAVGGVADRFTFAIYNGSSWSGATNASGGFLPVVNTWYHIAVVKEGTSTKLYVDGTLYGSGTFSGTPADNSNAVQIPYSSTNLNADISNVRFIRGTALYTSNFTPPTKPLTAITNTKLLTCQGNTITDASSSDHTITANGDAAANLGYPASAFEFDGSDDYVILSDFDKAAYGTTNFSLSLWFNADSGTYKSILQVASALNSATPWIGLINYVSNGLRVYVNGDYRLYQSYTQGVWNNFVITFDSAGSGSWTFYLNGSSVGTYTGPIGTNSASATYLGNAYGANYFDGKISNFVVHQKTLTAAEVEQNYNALKRRYA